MEAFLFWGWCPPPLYTRTQSAREQQLGGSNLLDPLVKIEHCEWLGLLLVGMIYERIQWSRQQVFLAPIFGREGGAAAKIRNRERVCTDCLWTSRGQGGGI